MNKTIELVTAWAAFEEAQPTATVADFCTHYLGSQHSARKAKSAADEHVARYTLSRVINRLSRLWMYFTGAALKPVGLGSFEEFAFLFTVSEQQPIRKKDLILQHYLEMSSGLLVIERLVSKGMITEANDLHDKRSKLLSLTKAGRAALQKGREKLDEVATAHYGLLGPAQLAECMKHLVPLEHRMGQQWQAGKKGLPE